MTDVLGEESVMFVKLVCVIMISAEEVDVMREEERVRGDEEVDPTLTYVRFR